MNKKIALLTALFTTVIAGCNSGGGASTNSSSPATVADSPEMVTDNTLKAGQENIVLLRHSVMSQNVMYNQGFFYIDKGTLIQAATGTGEAKDFYLFTPDGVGPKNFVLIGTKYQIIKYLRQSNRRFKNNLYPDLGGKAGFYISVARYTEGERYKELGNIYDFTNELMTEISTSFGLEALNSIVFDTNKATDLLGAIVDAIDLKKSYFSSPNKEAAFQTADSKTQYYVQIAPMAQTGFVRIDNHYEPACQTPMICRLDAIPRLIANKNLFK